MHKNQTIPPGFKPSPLGPIPGDWSLNRIGDFAKTTAGGTPSTGKKEYWGGNIKWMSSGELNLKRVYDTEGRITEEGLKNSSTKMLPEKCILIGLAGQGKTRGTVAMNMIQLCTNQSVAAILPSDIFVEEYLYYNLDSRYEELRQLSTGEGGRGGLNLNIINSIKIPLPPLPEQTAISNLLSTWDKAIETTQKLISQKKLSKKWFMQVLLTGKKRLKEYDKKWEEVSFKKTFIFIKTYSFTRDELTTNPDFKSTYCIHYGDIHALYYSEFLDFKQQTLIPKIADYQYMVNERDLLKDGDIIIADASEDYNGVGEAVEVINIQDKKTVGGLHTIVLRNTSDKTENGFRAYLFSSESIRNNLRRKATGISVYSISKSTLEKLTFKLPEKQEQSAIAQILSSVDKEIHLFQTKLEKLKEQKKGLMQVLLTGKKRLKTE